MKGSSKNPQQRERHSHFVLKNKNQFLEGREQRSRLVRSELRKSGVRCSCYVAVVPVDPGGDVGHVCDSRSNGVCALERCSAVGRASTLDFDDLHTPTHGWEKQTPVHLRAQTLPSQKIGVPKSKWRRKDGWRYNQRRKPRLLFHPFISLSSWSSSCSRLWGAKEAPLPPPRQTYPLA